VVREVGIGARIFEPKKPPTSTLEINTACPNPDNHRPILKSVLEFIFNTNYSP
jgi:hypothetical protein